VMEHLPVSVRQVVEGWSQSIGFPEDQIMFLLVQVLLVPLGWIHVQIRAPVLRHFFSMGLGILVLFLQFGPWGLVHVFICSFSGFLAIKVLPESIAATGALCVSLGYLGWRHAIRYIVDYGGWRIDASTALMIASVKTSMFAFVYIDKIKLLRNEAFNV